MAQQADASGSLALSPRPRDAGRTVATTLDNRRTLHAATALDPAEIAQARVFERLLKAECAELQELAQRTGRATDALPDADDSEPTQDLTELRARLDEIRDLLRALQGRFPRAQPELDR